MDYSLYKGLISVYIGAICVYPIDVIKTRMQNINYKNEWMTKTKFMVSINA